MNVIKEQTIDVCRGNKDSNVTLQLTSGWLPTRFKTPVSK